MKFTGILIFKCPLAFKISFGGVGKSNVFKILIVALKSLLGLLFSNFISNNLPSLSNLSIDTILPCSRLLID